MAVQNGFAGGTAMGNGVYKVHQLRFVPAGEPETFEEAVDAVLSMMRDVMIRKHRDYGPGNIAAFGELGVLVRASDKVQRLKNLLFSGRAPENETVDDTWLDLANYGLIALMLRHGWWGLPLEE